jgi:hypothetical protein
MCSRYRSNLAVLAMKRVVRVTSKMYEWERFQGAGESMLLCVAVSRNQIALCAHSLPYKATHLKLMAPLCSGSGIHWRLVKVDAKVSDGDR